VTFSLVLWSLHVLGNRDKIRFRDEGPSALSEAVGWGMRADDRLAGRAWLPDVEKDSVSVDPSKAHHAAAEPRHLMALAWGVTERDPPLIFQRNHFRRVTTYS
jgi:hypothetical protein